MPFEAKQGRKPHPHVPNAYIVTNQDLATYDDAAKKIEQMPLKSASEFNLSHKDNGNRYLFIAVFDGTGNDATQGLTARTNPGHLYRQFDDFIHHNTDDGPDFHRRMHARYIEGPGTQAGRVSNIHDQATGVSAQDRIFEMYKDLGQKTRQWKIDNKEVDVSVSVIAIGFSRGAVEAAQFAAIVGKYGIHADAEYSGKSLSDWWNGISPKEMKGPPMIGAEKVPIAAALFDPVATGDTERFDRELPPSVRSALQLTARDEHRVMFPVNKIVTDELVQAGAGRFANLMVAGCHSDVGGGYKDGTGLAHRSHNLMATYLNGLTGHPICRPMEVYNYSPNVSRTNFTDDVVHDSNLWVSPNLISLRPDPTPGHKMLGMLHTGYAFADRTQDESTIQNRQNVKSGVNHALNGYQLNEGLSQQYQEALEKILVGSRQAFLEKEGTKLLQDAFRAKFEAMSVPEQMDHLGLDLPEMTHEDVRAIIDKESVIRASIIKEMVQDAETRQVPHEAYIATRDSARGERKLNILAEYSTSKPDTDLALLSDRLRKEIAGHMADDGLYHSSMKPPARISESEPINSKAWMSIRQSQQYSHAPTPRGARAHIDGSEYLRPDEQPHQNPKKLLRESASHIAILLNKYAEPKAEKTLDFKTWCQFREYDFTNQERRLLAQERLSAAVTAAALSKGMDRIGHIRLSDDGKQLIVVDRRDTHSGLVKTANVDVAAALATKAQDSLPQLASNDHFRSATKSNSAVPLPQAEATQQLHSPKLQKLDRNEGALAENSATGSIRPNSKPEPLFQQAFNMLESDKTLSEKSRIETARNIASQANSDKLTRIDYLIPGRDSNGRDAYIATQESPYYKQSLSVPVSQINPPPSDNPNVNRSLADGKEELPNAPQAASKRMH